MLKISEKKVTVYGTPWDGKEHLSTNTSCLLKAVCILDRGEKNQINCISKKEALPMLCQQSYRSADPVSMMKILKLIDRLSSNVELYYLKCNMEPEAAQIAYSGMNQERTVI